MADRAQGHPRHGHLLIGIVAIDCCFHIAQGCENRCQGFSRRRAGQAVDQEPNSKRTIGGAAIGELRPLILMALVDRPPTHRLKGMANGATGAIGQNAQKGAMCGVELIVLSADTQGRLRLKGAPLSKEGCPIAQ